MRTARAFASRLVTTRGSASAASGTRAGHRASSRSRRGAVASNELPRREAGFCTGRAVTGESSTRVWSIPSATVSSWLSGSTTPTAERIWGRNDDNEYRIVNAEFRIQNSDRAVRRLLLNSQFCILHSAFISSVSPPLSWRLRNGRARPWFEPPCVPLLNARPPCVVVPRIARTARARVSSLPYVARA
jgi:hypothetical protein